MQVFSWSHYGWMRTGRSKCCRLKPWRQGMLLALLQRFLRCCEEGSTQLFKHRRDQVFKSPGNVNHVWGNVSRAENTQTHIERRAHTRRHSRQKPRQERQCDIKQSCPVGEISIISSFSQISRENRFMQLKGVDSQKCWSFNPWHFHMKYFLCSRKFNDSTQLWFNRWCQGNKDNKWNCVFSLKSLERKATGLLWVSSEKLLQLLESLSKVWIQYQLYLHVFVD